MLMRMSYDKGIILSDEEQKNSAIMLGKEYHPILNWNTGLPFFLLGEKARVDSIDDLYNLLVEYGPCYAAYKIPWTTNGHIVLVTGVDVNHDLVFTKVFMMPF